VIRAIIIARIALLSLVSLVFPQHDDAACGLLHDPIGSPG